MPLRSTFMVQEDSEVDRGVFALASEQHKEMIGRRHCWEGGLQPTNNSFRNRTDSRQLHSCFCLFRTVIASLVTHSLHLLSSARLRLPSARLFGVVVADSERC